MQAPECAPADEFWHDRVSDRCQDVQSQLTEVLQKMHRPKNRGHRVRLALFEAEEIQLAMTFQINSVLRQRS